MVKISLEEFRYYKGKQKILSTKNVVAIGIGSALYCITSGIAFPIGLNTTIRFSIALLNVFGVYYGPVVGFFVGFIGHCLNDMIFWGSLWLGWAFYSGCIGFFSGFLFLNKNLSYDYKIIDKKKIFKLIILSIIGMVVGGAGAFIGDVYFYQELPVKVLFQLLFTSTSNMAVILIFSITLLISLEKRYKKKN